MQSAKNNFFIKEKTLAKALSIDLRILDDKIAFLESSSESNFQIKEWIHFIYRNKNLKIRIFSKQGVLAIAKYLDFHGKTTDVALRSVLILIEEHRQNQIDANIRQKIYNHSSSLILSKQRHWLSYKDTYKIFKTTKSRLDEAFKNIQTSDTPMSIDEEFQCIEDILYFSFSGLEKLSIELAARLYSKQRRDYCQRVPIVTPPVLEYLTLAPSPSTQDIDRAMRYAKARDKEKCQITGDVRDKYTEIKLVKHHLFDKNNYRPLAADPDNIITISEQISDEFHQWNGGYDKSCTIDDFIEYIELFYPDKYEVVLMLLNRRSVLEVKLSQFQRHLPQGND
jgi:hypothetical protein